MIVGTEWLIEATGCDPDALRNQTALQAVLSGVIADLGLKSIGSVWHKFDGEGGVTGLIALTESHLACHTYPEYSTATFNLYCCRTRPEWNWEANLKEQLGASTISVTRIERGGDQSQISDLKFETEIPQAESEISDFTVAGFRNTRPPSGREFDIAGGSK